jgi:signal peptidase I
VTDDLVVEGIEPSPPELPEEDPIQRRGIPPLVWLLEWVTIIGAALLLAFGVRAFVLQTYYIPTGSMEPTLHIGDRILVFKLAYVFGSPQRGDVVVFKAPAREAVDCGDSYVPDLVKRIVGLPGETISSVHNVIFIDHRPLEQPWAHYEPLDVAPITPQTIPANHYFMIGDNQPNSCDSRYWGTIPRSSIIGEAVFKIWPLSQFGTI